MFHSGTALPPFIIMTSIAASSSMPFMPPADGMEPAMAWAIFVIVTPWSASPKWESISVSSSCAAVTAAQALRSLAASSSLFIPKHLRLKMTNVNKTCSFTVKIITYVRTPPQELFCPAGAKRPAWRSFQNYAQTGQVIFGKFHARSRTF